MRQQKYVVRGGAVLFRSGETGEIILTGAITTSYEAQRYRLVGRSFSQAPDAVEVKLSLRKAHVRDGTTSTVTGADGRIVTLQGIDHVSSASKRFEIDVGTAFWWVQFQMRVPKSIATDGRGERWGMLGVSLVHDGSKADPLR